MKIRNLFFPKEILIKESSSSQYKIKNTLKKPYINTLDKTIQNLLKRRRESIINSMTRPLYQEALRNLFLVIILLVDTLIPLEILRILINPLNIIIAIITLIIFMYLEMRIYNLLWGKKGRWSIEKYKKISENIKEDTN